MNLSTAISSPLEISGLVAWYDFSDATTMFTDTGRTTPVASDADSIRSMADKSGVGNHLVQGAATLDPAYKVNVLGGRSGGLFDGDDALETANLNYAQPNTIFVVGKHADGLANKHFCDGDGAAGRHIVGTDTGPVWRIYAGTSLTGGATDTNDNIIVAQFNGASSKIYVNGGSANASGNAGAQPLGNTDRFIVGAGAGAPASSYLPNGSYIYELIVYNAALSVANINRVGDYIETKWGLTWTAAT